MQKGLNQSLVIRLEMLSLEPAGSCFSVHGEEGHGSFYLFNHQILAAAYGPLSGEEAVRALLDRKDFWVFENPEAYPDSADLNIYLEAILVDLLDPARQLGTEKKVRLFSSARQTLMDQYELNVSVQGGLWDGQTFALFPGLNPVGRLAEAVSGGRVGSSRSNSNILVDESNATIIDDGFAGGVRLNGKKVSRAQLSPEDVIVLGEVTLKLHYIVRQPISIRVAAEEERTSVDTNSRQAIFDRKTINWKEFAPKK